VSLWRAAALLAVLASRSSFRFRGPTLVGQPTFPPECDGVRIFARHSAHAQLNTRRVQLRGMLTAQAIRDGCATALRAGVVHLESRFGAAGIAIRVALVNDGFALRLSAHTAIILYRFGFVK
jgi:hypothetical protein